MDEQTKEQAPICAGFSQLLTELQRAHKLCDGLETRLEGVCRPRPPKPETTTEALEEALEEAPAASQMTNTLEELLNRTAGLTERLTVILNRLEL